MRVLVTGGTGFIGSHLVGRLLQSDHQVITVSRRAAAASPGIEHHAVDITGEIDPAAFGSLDAIVHLAGLADASSSFANPVLYSRVNALGTLNLLELARRKGARFILASSQRVYRPALCPIPETAPLEPGDPYGYSKKVAEEWVRMYRELYRLPSVVLRFFTVYGPGQDIVAGSSGVVAIFVRRALAGDPLEVSGRSLRDFTHVDDVVRGISLALDSPAATGQIFNIATGVGTTIPDLARAVVSITNSTSAILGGGQGGLEGYVADIGKARADLGFAPVIELRQGLEQYVSTLTGTGAYSAQGKTDG